MSIRAGIAYGLLGFGVAFLAGAPLGAAALYGLGAGIVGGILSELPPIRRGYTFIHTRTQPYYVPYYDWGVSRVRRVRTYFHEQNPPMSHHRSYQQQHYANGPTVPTNYTTPNAQPTTSGGWFPSLFGGHNGPKSHTSRTPSGGTRTQTTPSVPPGTHVNHHRSNMAPPAPPTGANVRHTYTTTAPSGHSHTSTGVTHTRTYTAASPSSHSHTSTGVTHTRQSFK